MPLVGLALCVLSTQTGCVKRRYTIRTDPPGALVYVNGEEVGTTPVSRSYTYYADREITLVADGYKTQTVIQPVKAPWWDNSLTDFVSENLLPVTLRDEREFTYRMEPERNAPPENVIAQAQVLRQEASVPPPPKRKTFLQWIGLTQ
jgi:hypothetical protein